MELIPNNKRIEYKKPLIKRRIAKEETVEVNVPDIEPDVLRVICADASPMLRNKESDAGKVTVSGLCDITVLYEPEQGTGTKKISTNAQFSLSLDAEGANQDSLLVAEVTLASIDTRMVNSRKLIIRFELMYMVEAYSASEIRYLAGIDGSDSLQLNFSEETVVLPESVTERTFVITDSVNAQKTDDILSYTTDFALEEVKSVGSKVVVRGNARTTILYLYDGSVESIKLESPFSQVVETDRDCEASEYIVTIMPTSMYVTKSFSESNSRDELSIEIHAVAQCVAYYEETVRFVVDMYDTKCHITFDTISQCVHSLKDISSVKLSDKTGIETEKPVRAVINSWARAGAAEITENTLNLSVTPGALVTDYDENLLCVSRKTTFSDNMQDADCREIASISNNGSGARSNGSEVEVSSEFEVQLLIFDSVQICYLDNIEEIQDDSTSPAKRPSIIVYRVCNGESLWSVCKRFKAVVDSVKELNELNCDEVNAGAVLIIPKS